MAPTYEQYTQTNQGIGSVLDESTYNEAVAKFGKMPGVRKGPDGNYFWTQDHGLGLPTGRMVSTMGTNYARAARGGDNPQAGMGSVFAPDDIYQTAKQTGAHMGTALGELYDRGGVLDAFGSQNPLDYGFETPASTGTALPARARVPQNNPVGQPQTGAQQQIGDFLSWWRNEGPRMEGPLGDIYNTPEGRTFDTPYGQQRIMPGMVGKSFSMSDTLFPERLQSYQLQNNQSPYGPISPLMPPHLVAEAGYGASDILGGQWGPGQVAASDPSTGSVFNQGASGYFNSQTPQGPYSGFQFPQFFGQPGVFAPGGDGAFQGGGFLDSNPGTGGSGTFQPTPGAGGSGGGTFNPNPFPPIGGGGGTGGGGDPGTVPPTTPPPGGGAPGGGGGASLPPPPTPTDPGAGVTGGSFQPDPMQSDSSAWLASMGQDYDHLLNFAQNGGAPVDVLPAWEAMVAAQDRNLDRRFADIQESFNVTGNRYGTPFAQAAVDFQTQAGLDQNSLLAQMQLAALEAGRGRQFGAANSLANMAYGGISQLSNQDFQSAMRQMDNSYNLASQMYQGSIGGANSLQNAAMQAVMGMYGTESGAGMSEAQRQLALTQLGLSNAGLLSNLWGQNLGLGNQLGMGQYGVGQDQIDRVYQEWLRTRNYNNPMLPYMYAGAMGFQPVFPVNNNSGWGQALAGIGGQILANLPMFGGG